jgi:hypothetical protein
MKRVNTINKGQGIRLALATAALACACALSPAAWAQSSGVPCDNGVANDLQTSAQNALTEQKARIDKAVADNNLDVAPPASGNTLSGASGLGAVNLSCFNSLFGSMSNFSIPSIDQILQGVGQAAVNAACNAAESAIRSATSGFNLSQTLNTGIPGFPNVSGSVGVGSGNSLSLIGNGTSGSTTVSGLTGMSGSVSNTTGSSVVSGASSSVKNWLLGN